MPFFGKSGTSRISSFSPSQFAGLLGSLIGTWDTICFDMIALCSSNLKRTESRHRFSLGFLYIINARRPRPFLQPRPQSGQLFARSHGPHFNAAVMIVPHPSRNLQDVRLTLDKPAETHALHTSTY